MSQAPKDNHQPQSVGVTPPHLQNLGNTDDAGTLIDTLVDFTDAVEMGEEPILTPPKNPATIDIDKELEKILNKYFIALTDKTTLVHDATTEAKAQITALITEKENRAREEEVEAFRNFRAATNVKKELSAYIENRIAILKSKEEQK